MSYYHAVLDGLLTLAVAIAKKSDGQSWRGSDAERAAKQTSGLSAFVTGTAAAWRLAGAWAFQLQRAGAEYSAWCVCICICMCKTGTQLACASVGIKWNVCRCRAWCCSGACCWGEGGSGGAQTGASTCWRRGWVESDEVIASVLTLLGLALGGPEGSQPAQPSPTPASREDCSSCATMSRARVRLSAGRKPSRFGVALHAACPSQSIQKKPYRMPYPHPLRHRPLSLRAGVRGLSWVAFAPVAVLLCAVVATLVPAFRCAASPPPVRSGAAVQRLKSTRADPTHRSAVLVATRNPV